MNGTGGASVRREQIAAIARDGVVGAISAMVGAGCMAAGLIYLTPALWPDVAAWLAVLVLPYGVHLALCRAHRRAAAPDAPRFARRFAAVAAAEGVVWGLGIVWFAARGAVEGELFTLLLGAGVAAGAAMSFGADLPIFLGRFLPATLPYAAWAVLRGDGLHLILAGVVVIYTVVILQLARQFNASFLDNLRLRLANAALAEELRVRKDAAEQASADKSRFLAAASHDLRQPVHALGMFVGALAARVEDLEGRRLLGHVEASLEAMDLLFGSLLDLSRLDAGVVEARPADFPLQPLLARIVAEHAAEARARGLRLALSPTGAVVHTDPALLERMLRNLLANALRYTPAGRVLVGCRRIGGQLGIQVWDTGRGIPPAEQQRIFEEFAQLSDARHEGLGLGLAIVRRLSALTGCPVALCSEPGRGSVFTVHVPLAAAAVAPPPPLPPPARGARILVVDDSPPVRAAMAALLRGWGHDPVLAGSAAEARAAVAAGGPDLVICDLALPGGMDGVATVAALRQACGESLPALLITGETDPAALRRAKDSGLALLHKPVPQARLRAAIGNLLRADVLA